MNDPSVTPSERKAPVRCDHGGRSDLVYCSVCANTGGWVNQTPTADPNERTREIRDADTSEALDEAYNDGLIILDTLRDAIEMRDRELQRYREITQGFGEEDERHLRDLAVWFDLEDDDERFGANAGDEVQRDLRRIATAISSLRAALVEGARDG